MTIKTYKIILVGNASVGKTSLRRIFMGNSFKESYSMTIGADFSVYRHTDGKTIHIWDLAGELRFQHLIQAYYAGTLGALVVFDLTNPDSFENISKWMEDIYTNVNGQKIPIILVGNKSDLRYDSPTKVTDQEAHLYANQLSEWLGYEILYINTSAKTGDNVEIIFHALINKIEEYLINN